MVWKPTVAVEFDGVIHSYTSGWKGADVIADPPNEGVIAWMHKATEDVILAVVTPRSNLRLIQKWLIAQFVTSGLTGDKEQTRLWVEDNIHFLNTYPPANMYISARGYRYVGTLPTGAEMLSFKPKRGQPSTEFASVAAAVILSAKMLHEDTCAFNGGEGPCGACEIEDIMRPFL